MKLANGITKADIEDLCDKWAQFLLSHFPKEHDIRWEDTNFYKWMRSRHWVCPCHSLD